MILNDLNLNTFDEFKNNLDTTKVVAFTCSLQRGFYYDLLYAINKFVKVEVAKLEENPFLITQFNIKQSPCTILIKDGKEVFREYGEFKISDLMKHLEIKNE